MVRCYLVVRSEARIQASLQTDQSKLTGYCSQLQAQSRTSGLRHWLQVLAETVVLPEREAAPKTASQQGCRRSHLRTQSVVPQQLQPFRWPLLGSKKLRSSFGCRIIPGCFLRNNGEIFKPWEAAAFNWLPRATVQGCMVSRLSAMIGGGRPRQSMASRGQKQLSHAAKSATTHGGRAMGPEHV